jgi:hypothetical protein
LSVVALVFGFGWLFWLVDFCLGLVCVGLAHAQTETPVVAGA